RTRFAYGPVSTDRRRSTDASIRRSSRDRSTGPPTRADAPAPRTDFPAPRRLRSPGSVGRAPNPVSPRDRGAARVVGIHDRSGDSDQAGGGVARERRVPRRLDSPTLPSDPRHEEPRAG